MINDAFSANVDYGGLRSISEIKILLCYILAATDGELNKSDLCDALISPQLANYFDVLTAYDDLLSNKNICESENTCSLTESGNIIAKTLDTALPLTVRSKAVNSALKLASTKQKLKENSVTIENIDNKIKITCTINDFNREMMSISITVSDILQVEHIKQQFLADPAKVYQTTMQLMSGIEF